MNIPYGIERIIGDRKYIVDNVGMSSSKVICFDDMVLKTDVEQSELAVMQWLDGKLPVPKILAYETADDVNYLLMSRINGDMLCENRYMNNPKVLVKLLAEALNMLWGIDLTDCPCDFSLDKKLKIAQYRVENNLCDTDDAEPETYGSNGFANPKELLKWLISNKPNETFCLSHGDFCLPNIFAYNGKINGFIDLGRCGTADKYQDLALCYRSLRHNLQGKYTGKAMENFDAYNLFVELGIQPDMELINYYILLDELF